MALRVSKFQTTVRCKGHSYPAAGKGPRAPCIARMAAAPAALQNAPQGDLERLVQQWMRWDKNEETRAKVQQLWDAGKVDQLQDLLGSRLEFGTAGLRGKMGPGTSRMNGAVVQQTAQGLCAYLQRACPQELQQGGVVVGYDGRHGSRAFAHVTAAVFASRGLRVALFRRVAPTPWVAAGVAELGAAAGVMVTASHNPKEYNGYKVYWGNGCQIIPPHDAGIAAAIADNLEPWDLAPYSNPHDPHDKAAEAALLGSPLLSDPWDTVTAAYHRRLAALRWLPAEGSVRAAALRALGVPVYTPLHGVGAEPLLRAFQVMGLPAPYIVPEQRQPDPDFPTVVFPNPEEGKGTWNLAFQAGVQQGARLVLANDPDADRLCVAERCPSAPGGWRVFSGNEMGALLAHWVWSNFRRTHPEVPAARCVMLSSAVSSRLLAAMAAAEGFRHVTTLTGFKWLGSTARELEGRGGAVVLFAFEEAIGFMLGGMYRDKDGISAAAVFTELAAYVYGRGGTLEGLLGQLYDKYGYFDYRSGYFIADRPEKSRAVFAELRGANAAVEASGSDGGSGTAISPGRYTSHIAGVPVEHVRDLGTGYDSSEPGGRAVLPWQAGDMMITYTLQGGATLTLRASGTEPKLKYYLEVRGDDAAAAGALAARLEAAIAEELVGAARHGLTRPAASS